MTESSPDIIIDSVTWLYPSILEREVLIHRYNIIARRDRKQEYHGDAIIAARENLAGCEIYLNMTSETTAASFQNIDKEPLIICTQYRPQSSDQANMEEVCTQISGLSISLYWHDRIRS